MKNKELIDISTIKDLYEVLMELRALLLYRDQYDEIYKILEQVDYLEAEKTAMTLFLKFLDGSKFQDLLIERIMLKVFTIYDVHFDSLGKDVIFMEFIKFIRGGGSLAKMNRVFNLYAIKNGTKSN